MRPQRLIFVYVLATTIVMGIAWAATNGPWTQGETLVGVGVLLLMLVFGWEQR